MKVIVGGLLVITAVALATATNTLPAQVQNALTTIDTVPTKAQLDAAFNNGGVPGPPVQSLSMIARDADVDTGIRLRAIHALAKYCPATPCTRSDLAHEAVVEVIDTIIAKDTPRTGSEVLLLRAAIETLGLMRVSDDVTMLVDLLEDRSRDIRTASARALRDLCNVQATIPLRTRYSAETTDQVKLAISEALRILGQCSTNQ